MDKSQQILKIARDRLGNKPTYNPFEFLEMCAVIRDELEAAEHSLHSDGAKRPAEKWVKSDDLLSELRGLRE